MKETINQWFSSNFNADKAEKYNGWAAMIELSLALVHMQLLDKSFQECSSSSKSIPDDEKRL